jgi:DNA-binding NarL/FixJ family response regulator
MTTKPLPLPAARILVADDDRPFRNTLTDCIRKYWPQASVWTANDGEDAVRRCASLAPDVVLMDISMPRLDGFEAVRRIHQAAPSTHILMLTASTDPKDAMEAVSAGAEGYVTKLAPPRKLIGAIVDVMEGGAYVEPRLAREVFREASKPRARVAPYGGGDGDGALLEEIRSKLTIREFEVVGLVSGGLSNRQVGEMLGIAENTVKVHLARVLDKLRLRNRQQLAALATRAGLTVGAPPEPPGMPARPAASFLEGDRVSEVSQRLFSIPAPYPEPPA